MNETEYTISVSNTFDATSPEDAVSQMVLWIEQVARHAGYRWENETGFITGFIDADRIDIFGYSDENAIAELLALKNRNSIILSRATRRSHT